MKNTIKYIAVFILTLAIFNCSKDDDGGSSPEENIRLKTYGIDANEYDITYNAEGKPSGFETSLGNNIIAYNGDNQIIQIGNLSYTYNSQDKLATINRSDSEANFIYNSQGQLAVMNGFTNDPFYYHLDRNYSYDSQGRLKEIEETASNTTKTKVILTYDSKDNIVQVKTQISYDLINYVDGETITITYDNKKNPTKDLLTQLGITDTLTLYNLSPLYTYYFGSYVWSRMYYYSSNNIMSISTTSSSYTSDNQFTYTYNEAGYPIAADKVVNSSTFPNYTQYYSWTYETVD